MRLFLHFKHFFGGGVTSFLSIARYSTWSLYFCLIDLADQMFLFFSFVCTTFFHVLSEIHPPFFSLGPSICCPFSNSTVFIKCIHIKARTCFGLLAFWFNNRWSLVFFLAFNHLYFALKKGLWKFTHFFYRKK